jgi:redox-sensitive bicupin YhaK (pirin superfamily)
MRDPVLATRALGNPPWPTLDPFLFCVHHNDAYPAGNDAFGVPPAMLSGRNMGSDFSGQQGFSMYHGEEVPGFPAHPHRGFETVTLARRGYIDHSDSLGARARFGHGDVQWMTAGAGVVHSEMFPLLDRTRPNPAELFQIWLNLPAADKMVQPYFTMLWSHQIPRQQFHDGGAAEVTVMAGALGDVAPPPPPPNSWASRPEAGVAIWTIRLAPGARWTLPAAAAGLNRALYFFDGDGLTLGGEAAPPKHLFVLRSDAAVSLEASRPAELLLLQGRPLGEPVVQHGPFVMNTRAEIEQAFADYRRTRFGGWPWPRVDPIHGADGARFAVHADGREERPKA